MSRGQDNTKKADKAKTMKPKSGTVTFGGVRRVKTPRPDRHGPAGRKKVAEASRVRRAKERAKRVASPAAAEALSAKEQNRTAAIERLLRECFTRACAHCGVDPESMYHGERPRPPSLSQWALALYGHAAREAGCRWADFTTLARPGRPGGGLLIELRSCTHYSKMKPLLTYTGEVMAKPGKSTVIAVLRDASRDLTAWMSARMAEVETRYGPRPRSNGARSAAPPLAASVKKAASKVKAGTKKAAKKATKAKEATRKRASKKAARAARPRQAAPNVGHDHAEGSIERLRVAEEQVPLFGGDNDTTVGEAASSVEPTLTAPVGTPSVASTLAALQRVADSRGLAV